MSFRKAFLLACVCCSCCAVLSQPKSPPSPARLWRLRRPIKDQPSKVERKRPTEKARRRRRRRLGAALILTGQRALGVAVLALPRLSLWSWRALPASVPSWWRAHGLTSDALGQAAFLASNGSYLYAGLRLLGSGHGILGYLMLGVCAASCAYHGAQCGHGCGSAAAARWCQIDTVLALATAGVFMQRCRVAVPSAALAALSLAFFSDSFGLVRA